jgi:long-chain-fatty-acid---luciferin-component ligase
LIPLANSALSSAPATSELSANVRVDRLRASSELDSLISSEQSVFDLSLEEQRRLRLRLVVDAHHSHRARCPEYGAFVERTFGDREIGSTNLLDTLPAFPTSVFKRAAPLSVPANAIEKWCSSSGTTGGKSRVPRDRASLERLLGSVRAGMTLLHEWYEHENTVINLGPDRHEAGDVWFGYVMSLVELLYPTRCRVREGIFRVDEALNDIAELLSEGTEVTILGPPFLTLSLVEAAERERVRISGGNRLTIVTAGGWKRYSGAAVPRKALNARLVEAFGLDDDTRIRDAFNQVELNTVMLECAGHQKHVPPWVHATTRDPATLAAQPRGELGLLSFLDASAEAYPCFIVTDDFGIVREGRCACGREGTFLEIVRRVRGLPERGCALTMDRSTRLAEARRHD